MDGRIIPAGWFNHLVHCGSNATIILLNWRFDIYIAAQPLSKRALLTSFTRNYGEVLCCTTFIRPLSKCWSYRPLCVSGRTRYCQIAETCATENLEQTPVRLLYQIKRALTNHSIARSLCYAIMDKTNISEAQFIRMSS
jgi:hypothetical protein